jgi:lysophospholipase L1-like esterase
MNHSPTRAAALAVLNLLCLDTFAAAPSGSDTPIAIQNYKSPIRVACIGDSITQGVGTANQDFHSYPAQLKRMMDPHWEVVGFGYSGATLVKSCKNTYHKTPMLERALRFQPDIVVIMLGTNDAGPVNWVFKNDFTFRSPNQLSTFCFPIHKSAH